MSDEIDSIPDQVTFDYIKGNQFRVVHADGIWGGLSSRLNIFMAVWNERPAIPKRVVHRVSSDLTIGEEIVSEREGRDSVVREVEVGVMLSVPLAKAMIKWLQDKVDAAEKIVADEVAKEKK